MAPDQPATVAYTSDYAWTGTWNSNATNDYYWSDQVYDGFTGEWMSRLNAALLADKRACRCRDLSYLHRDALPRNVQIRKPVLVRFQPMWSANRCRSVT